MWLVPLSLSSLQHPKYFPESLATSSLTPSSYPFGPLLIFFEPTAELHYRPHPAARMKRTSVDGMALLISCYKSEKLIGANFRVAPEIFTPQNKLVIATGNSPASFDDIVTECTQYGVNHTWSTIGQKVIAQYVGCYVGKKFPLVLVRGISGSDNAFCSTHLIYRLTSILLLPFLCNF